jgi:hypothetical protein
MTSDIYLVRENAEDPYAEMWAFTDENVANDFARRNSYHWIDTVYVDEDYILEYLNKEEINYGVYFHLSCKPGDTKYRVSKPSISRHGYSSDPEAYNNRIASYNGHVSVYLVAKSDEEAGARARKLFDDSVDLRTGELKSNVD